ncbi:MAG: HAMP domain-containing sensor histidine kinase [Cutibacterium avidum]|nr:HAMP domain-containing sensor histidine kinase [Cutibacterium avidum]
MVRVTFSDLLRDNGQVTSPNSPADSHAPDPCCDETPEVRSTIHDTWLDNPTGPHTLGRRLVVRVIAMVAVLAVLLGGATTYGTNRILTKQLDEQVSTSLRKLARHPFGIGGPGPEDVLGNQVGTVFITQAGDLCQTSVVSEGSVTTAYCGERARALLDVERDGHGHDFDISDSGKYRVMAQTQDGITYVVAMPRTKLVRAIRELLALEGVATALVLATAYIGTRAVVIKSLRPLNQLASIATGVSEMDLDSGEVNLDVHIPPDLTDPRTEVGQVGQAFSHMLSNVGGALESRQKSEMKVRQFVADASHELRNPLASIRGYAELTRRRRDEMSPDAQFALGRIEAEASRMSALVEDMLLLARLDNDQKLDLQPTDLVELVLNAVSDSRAAGPDHVWTLDLPDEPVTVMADPDRLMQVVVNVLSNARKHTPAGVTVHTSVTRQRDSAVVIIADTGPGIPEAVKPLIFERFARADVSRTGSREGSTGLGMSIVAAVMAAHGGAAEVDSTDRGTTMTLRLPLA